LPSEVGLPLSLSCALSLSQTHAFSWVERS
jgi:hypothetical protein